MKNTIYITLLFVCIACYDYDKWREDFDASQLPRVEIVSAQPARANGADTVYIDVLFPSQTDSAFTIATFKIDGGTLIDNGKQEFTSTFAVIDRERSAKRIRSVLKMPTSSKAIQIRVEVPSIKYFYNRKITPVTMLPTSIKGEANKIGLQATFSDEILLSANMKAIPGLPTEGTKVSFVVADSLHSENNETYFRGEKASNANGEASVVFTAGNFGGYRGPLKVVASTSLPNGSTISDTFFIQLINPE